MSSEQKSILSWGVLTILSVSLLWTQLGQVSGELTRELGTVRYPLSFLETSHAYLYLMAFSLFFPFMLSFDRKVHYVGSWKYLLSVFVWVSSLYIVWDVLFTRWEIWEFNPDYISGLRLWGLPVEEISFFLVVPFACIFIYECIKAYELRKYLGVFSVWLMRAALLGGVILGFAHFGGYYTSTAVVVLTLAGFYMEWKFTKSERQDIYIMLLLSYIPFFIINGILTGWSTEAPIVVYNDSQNLPWRLGSIPIDDALYQAGMMMWMVFVYRGAKKNKKIFYFF